MYLRRCGGKSSGRKGIYWELVESYRTERGPRQRVVAYLGSMSKLEREGFEIAIQDSQLALPVPILRRRPSARVG